MYTTSIKSRSLSTVCPSLLSFIDVTSAWEISKKPHPAVQQSSSAVGNHLGTCMHHMTSCTIEITDCYFSEPHNRQGQVHQSPLASHAGSKLVQSSIDQNKCARCCRESALPHHPPTAELSVLYELSTPRFVANRCWLLIATCPNASS